ncbi:MAG: flippase-like domain-containing protein [Myxococcota bacterium]|nr:flippase-like domain-containing protein [Myxococcota bacterium]
MKQRLSFLGIGVPLVVSAAFVYWVAEGIESPERLLDSLATASWPFLLAIVPLNLLSHALRATRWRRLIGQEVSFFFTFSSVMVGYAVNGLLPRGGEVARLLNMSRATAVPMGTLLATLVAERLVDLGVLVLLLGVSLWLAGERVQAAFPQIWAAAPLAVAGAILGFAVLFLLAWKAQDAARFLGTILGSGSPRLAERAPKFVAQLGDGLSIVRRPKALLIATLETATMWALYIAVFCLGLCAFGLWDQVGLRGATVSYAITSSSALVPSAGQIGTFHALGRDALALLYGVDRDQALACVTALHLWLFYGIAGFGGLLAWLAQEVCLRRRGRLG